MVSRDCSLASDLVKAPLVINGSGKTAPLAMCLPQSPMIVNGINDVIGVNGANWRSIDANGDLLMPLASMKSVVSMAPLTTLAIRWYKWRFIGVIDANGVNDANGTNDSSGVIDFKVQWRM